MPLWKISRYAVKENSSSHRNQSGERIIRLSLAILLFSFPFPFPFPSVPHRLLPPPFPIPLSSDASVSPRGDEAISFVINRSSLIWYSLLFLFPFHPLRRTFLSFLSSVDPGWVSLLDTEPSTRPNWIISASIGSSTTRSRMSVSNHPSRFHPAEPDLTPSSSLQSSPRRFKSFVL